MTLPATPRPYFCLHCGQSLPGGAAFCSRCGQAVGHGADPPLNISPPPPLIPDVPAATFGDGGAAPVPTSPRVGEPGKPVAALGRHASGSVRRLQWRSLVVGLAVGALVASGAVAVVLRPTGSAGAGRLVELSVDALPATVMGRTRSDLEFRDRSPAQSDGIRSRAAAGIGSYVRSYGGSGIDIDYGVYAARVIHLIAVNGDLNLPLALPAVVVEQNGAVNPIQPLTVAGTTTTSCVYGPSDTIVLQGQAASVVIDHLLTTGPAAGKLVCVRRGPGGLFSVQLSGTAVSTDTPAGAAFQMASAVDQVWEELASR